MGTARSNSAWVSSTRFFPSFTSEHQEGNNTVMFNGAKNVVVTGGSFVANADDPPKGRLDNLIAEVAPNAILNAGGRADEVRCFPGTREEVIGRLEKFMDNKSPGRKRMMWLSGPAGAGKSAICQTVAERRKEQGRQAANFFFFRGDSTRGHSKPLVPTLVYQLRQFYPALDEPLSDCLEKDPLICSASIKAQFDQLLSSPIQTIQQSTPIQQPIVIIVDGLDECSNNERGQDQILAALHTLAYADHSPFLILVSSRAEPQLVMSFNGLGSSVQSIFLNEDYQPREDIRRFVVAKFAEIKKNHHLARTLRAEWPTDADIDAIVDKSSSQFAYAATVMRYLQLSSSSPALSLVTILKMGPPPGSHNPLAQLDAMYSYIFSKVLNIRPVKLILFARTCNASGDRLPYLLGLMGYKLMEIESFFADLVAVIKVITFHNDISFELYHASLDDYLGDKCRSMSYYVKENEIAAEVSSLCWKHIHNVGSMGIACVALSNVEKPTPELSESLLDASTKYVPEIEQEQDTLPVVALLIQMERLYWKHDKAQFKALLQSWSHFVSRHGMGPEMSDMVQAQDPSADLYYKQYRMAEEYGQQKTLTPPDFASVSNARSGAQITSARSSLNAAIDGPVHDSSIHIPGVFSRDIPTAPSKGRGSNSLPASKVKGKAPITPARTSPNTAGSSITSQMSTRKSGSSPRNVLVSPRKGRGGSPAPAGVSSLRSNTPITHASVSPNSNAGSSTHGSSVRKLEVSSQHTRATPPKGRGGGSLINQPGSTSRAINTHKEEGRGYRRGEYNDRPYELSKIRVKFHYNNNIRIMFLAPNTPFSEFVDKVAAKFGKSFNGLTLKFKDEDGDEIALHDDAEYEHAIETVRKTSKGKVEGALEIWCQNIAQ